MKTMCPPGYDHHSFVVTLGHMMYGTKICVYLHTKFQVSNMFLASFRLILLPPPLLTPQNEPLKSLTKISFNSATTLSFLKLIKAGK